MAQIEETKTITKEKTKEELKKEFFENFKKFVETASKEEILEFLYDALTVKESEEQSKYDFVYVAEKILNITARYFEFRMTEYTQKGVMFNYTYKLDKRWNGVGLTIDIEFPKDQVMSLARWHEWVKLAQKSDREVKKTLLKRLDFLSRIGGRDEEEVTPPQDKLAEKADELREKLGKGSRSLGFRSAG